MSTETLKDTNSPAYRNAATVRQEAALTIVRDLAAGTAQMRAKGTVYLPMEAGESQTAYDVRLARSLLFNTFVKVREGLAGMALKKRNPQAESDIELEDDVPLPLRLHVEDIDLAGNHLDVFAKKLFRAVINDGHAFILVDTQAPLTTSVTSAASVPDASDERAVGRRPYWVMRRKDDAINWRSDRINGETVLTQITFEERATENDGEYGEKTVTRYRVFKLPLVAAATSARPAIYGPMEWVLYEKRLIEKKEVIVQVGGNSTDLARIPVVTIYSREIGFLESEPPLIDLAYLNIGHWQQWSDLNCQIRMLVPVLHIKGELKTPQVAEGTQKQEMSWGPGTVVQTDKDGDVNYVSADPNAVGAAREALIDTENRMSAVGLSLIAAKGDREITATEKTMDQDERMSELASWLRALKDGIEAAFKIHAVDYLGLPEGGSIILGFDEPTNEDKEAVTAIDAPKGIPQPGQVMNGGVQ